MYCKMLGICHSAMLKKNNVWKSLVDRKSAQPLHRSIFSIQLELSTQVPIYCIPVPTTRTCIQYNYTVLSIQVYPGIQVQYTCSIPLYCTSTYLYSIPCRYSYSYKLNACMHTRYSIITVLSVLKLSTCNNLSTCGTPLTLYYPGLVQL